MYEVCYWLTEDRIQREIFDSMEEAENAMQLMKDDGYVAWLEDHAHKNLQDDEDPADEEDDAKDRNYWEFCDFPVVPFI